MIVESNSHAIGSEADSLTFDVLVCGVEKEGLQPAELDELIYRHTGLPAEKRKRLLENRKAIVARSVTLKRAHRVVTKLQKAGVSSKIRPHQTRRKSASKPEFGAREYFNGHFHPALVLPWVDPREFEGVSIKERQSEYTKLMSELADIHEQLTPIAQLGVAPIAQALLSSVVDLTPGETAGKSAQAAVAYEGLDGSWLWNLERYRGLLSRRLALNLSLLSPDISFLCAESRKRLMLSLGCHRQICGLHDKPVRLWRESVRYSKLREDVRLKDASSDVIDEVDRSRRTLTTLIDEVYAVVDRNQENCGVSEAEDFSRVPKRAGGDNPVTEKSQNKAASTHLPLHIRAQQCLIRFEHTHERVLSELLKHCTIVERGVLSRGFVDDTSTPTPDWSSVDAFGDTVSSQVGVNTASDDGNMLGATQPRFSSGRSSPSTSPISIG